MAGEEEAGPDLERELLLEERGENQRSGGGGAGAARLVPLFPPVTIHMTGPHSL